MRHQDQITQARKLLSYLDTRTTAMAESVYRNPVSNYTCPRQAALEREMFFRQPDGSLSVSLNVCRHRGARVAECCGSGAGSFSCPYHGWTYGLDGKLVARPDERSFTALDRDVRIAHPTGRREIRHGLGLPYAGGNTRC